jgi:hypothetical protein
MLRSKFMPAVAICTLSLFLISGVGCYGKFELTRALYQMNSSVKDKVARSLVTAAMIIFPVYWFGGAADWILFNTIEFWTGKNPINQEVINIKLADNGETEAVSTSRRTTEGMETIVTTYRHGQLDGTLDLRQTSGSPDIEAQMIWPNGAIERYHIHTDQNNQPIVERTDEPTRHGARITALE